MAMPAPIDPSTLPCSPLDEVCGIIYFKRMLEKIRLHAQGRLWADLHANLGIANDGTCCGFLHVDHATLTARVLQGGTDEDIFQWCQEQGRELNETDKTVWNAYYRKLGWDDEITPKLAARKASSGLASRDDIITMPHYIDVDEGRQP